MRRVPLPTTRNSAVLGEFNIPGIAVRTAQPVAVLILVGLEGGSALRALVRRRVRIDVSDKRLDRVQWRHGIVWCGNRRSLKKKVRFRRPKTDRSAHS